MSQPQEIVGEEKLGMPQAVTSLSSPWRLGYPTPPVMAAQLECIIGSQFLKPFSQDVRQLLDNIFKKQQREVWLGVYLTTFMMLHNCGTLTKREEDLATQLDLETKYARPEAVMGLHKGAVTLLAHFHSLVGGPTPIRLAGSSPADSSWESWSFTEEQTGFLKETYQWMTSTGEPMQTIQQAPFSHVSLQQSVLICLLDETLTAAKESRDRCNEMYWISQLYDEDWSPDKMNKPPR